MEGARVDEVGDRDACDDCVQMDYVCYLYYFSS